MCGGPQMNDLIRVLLVSLILVFAILLIVAAWLRT